MWHEICYVWHMNIRIKHGNYIEIDSEDLPKLMGKRVYLNHEGYATWRKTINKIRKHFYVARFVMGLDEFDGRYVDHIDRNPRNNQKSNLRIVDNSTNQFNIDPPKDKKHKCVSFRSLSKGKLYVGKMDYKYNQIMLMTSYIEDEAAYAYNCGLEYFNIEHAYRNTVELTEERKEQIKRYVFSRIDILKKKGRIRL